jgi:site-specific recombinase XerD
MEEVKNQINEWLLYCERNYAWSTREMYTCVMKQLLNHIKQNGQELTSSAIEKFLDDKYRSGRTRRCFNAYRDVISSFCGWRKKKYGIESPVKEVEQIKENNEEPRVLSEKEFQFVVDYARGMDKDILIFLGNTGLRREEFRSLKWGNIDPHLKFIKVTGKGNKHRIVPLNSACREVIEKYKRLSDDEPFQISQRYPGREGASWLCNRICKKTGMKKFRVHAIRHYFATELIRKGVSIYKVSKILGHTSVKTTEQIYIHLVPIDLLGITDVLDD